MQLVQKIVRQTYKWIVGPQKGEHTHAKSYHGSQKPIEGLVGQDHLPPNWPKVYYCISKTRNGIEKKHSKQGLDFTEIVSS